MVSVREKGCGKWNKIETLERLNFDINLPRQVSSYTVAVFSVLSVLHLHGHSLHEVIPIKAAVRKRHFHGLIECFQHKCIWQHHNTHTHSSYVLITSILLHVYFFDMGRVTLQSLALDIWDCPTNVSRSKPGQDQDQQAALATCMESPFHHHRCKSQPAEVAVQVERKAPPLVQGHLVGQNQE